MRLARFLTDLLLNCLVFLSVISVLHVIMRNFVPTWTMTQTWTDVWFIGLGCAIGRTALDTYKERRESA